jgi:phosphatidylglycerophosphate synthase
MLDAAVRRRIDPPLDTAAVFLSRAGVTANTLTVAGFVAGIAAVASIGGRQYALGLTLYVFNRVLDGLDGAVARRTSVTDLGAYLDIVFDFIVYSGVPLGFAIADPSRALAASFLIVSFVCTGTTFLAFAVFAAKRGLSTELRGRKSFYHLGGLTEGTETFVTFALMCLFPQAFDLLAYAFGTLCLVTSAGRVAAAVTALKSP